MHEQRKQVIGRAENYRNKSSMICWQSPRDHKLKKDIIIRTKLKFWILNIFVIKKKKIEKLQDGIVHKCKT